MLVDGRWDEPRSGQLRDAVDPATGVTLIRAADGSEADVDAAVAAAERKRRELGRGRAASPFERARVLRRIAAAIDEQLGDAGAAGERRHRQAASTTPRATSTSAAAWFDYYASLAVDLEGSTRHLDQGIALIRREPVGTVGIITPFNFPIALSSVKIAPALAAGCSVVHKPSEHTPLTALAVGQAGARGGAPSRTAQRGHRRRRDGLGAGAPPAGGEDRLHRLDRRRPAGGGRSLADRQEGDDGARRQVGEHRLRRRRPGSGPARAATSPTR